MKCSNTCLSRNLIQNTTMGKIRMTTTGCSYLVNILVKTASFVFNICWFLLLICNCNHCCFMVLPS